MDASTGLPDGLAEEAVAAARRAGLELRRGPAGLELRVPGGPAVVAAGELLARPRPGARDPLWRATLGGAGSMIDATAGLGADAFHLAAKGAAADPPADAAQEGDEPSPDAPGGPTAEPRVTMIERSAVLCALLADALARAAAGQLGPAARRAASRVRLLHGDAAELLGATLTADVVYLDPMFPSGRHGSAAPPKGMAVLRRLFAGEQEPSREEEQALLAAARAAAGRRVAVKRPSRAGPLGGVQPSGSLDGRTVRYDLYPPL